MQVHLRAASLSLASWSSPATLEVVERIEQGFLWMPLMSELALMKTSFTASMKQINEKSKPSELKSDGKFY